MAKSVKIEAIGAGLESDLPKIAAKIDPDLLAIMEKAEAKIVKAMAAAVTGFTGAELTDEDREALAKINEDLLESAGEWDRKRSDLIVTEAANIAKLAAKHAEDPVSLVQAITEAEAVKVQAKAKINEDQAEAEAVLAEAKAKIESKQANAGIEAFRTALGYTEGSTTGSGIRFALADHVWIVRDLLTTRDHYGIFVLHGASRTVWYYGIGKGIGKDKGGIKVDRETWINVGNMLDHKDSNSPTGAQRWFYLWLDHAKIHDDPEALTAYCNNVTLNGNLPKTNSGNTGGSANMSRLVAKVDPEAKRVLDWGSLSTVYKFDLDLLPKDPEAEAAEAAEAEAKIDGESEKPKAKAETAKAKAREAAKAKAEAAA